MVFLFWGVVCDAAPKSINHLPQLTRIAREVYILISEGHKNNTVLLYYTYADVYTKAWRDGDKLTQWSCQLA